MLGREGACYSWEKQRLESRFEALSRNWQQLNFRTAKWDETGNLGEKDGMPFACIKDVKSCVRKVVVEWLHLLKMATASCTSPVLSPLLYTMKFCGGLLPISTNQIIAMRERGNQGWLLDLAYTNRWIVITFAEIISTLLWAGRMRKEGEDITVVFWPCYF
jgi:hypothetical protein